MNQPYARGIAIIMIVAFILGSSLSCVGPQPGDPTATPGGSLAGGPVDSYVAVAPRVLRAGQPETVSVRLFNDQRPTTSNVQVALWKGTSRVAEASGLIQGSGDVVIDVPKLEEGDYEIQVAGDGFQQRQPVRVEDGTLVFVETDKPIYKPGQTMHIRMITLDPQLRPLASAVSVEVLDAKGIKVYKKEATTDDFGMVSVDLPLSAEPNLGVWKVTAICGKRQAQVDVRVERYVLPKYEVTLDLAREWVLASDPIKGTVKAEYSYGKPVRGEVQIRATRYVGTWQEFANVTKDLDGQVDFQLPAVQYVSGVPAAKGMGNVTLEVTVREKATGYEEKTTRLLTVASAPVSISVIPESVNFKPSLPLSFLVVAETPDKKPADATVTVDLAYTSSNTKNTTPKRDTEQVVVRGGKGLLKVTPPEDAISLTMNARSGNAYASLSMQAGYSPSGSFIHLEQVSEGTLKVGGQAKFHVTATKQAANFYYEVLARGTVVYSDVSQSHDIEFTLSPQMAPSARLLVYQILPTSEVAADYIPFSVEGDYPQKVSIDLAAGEVKPGDAVDIGVQTEGQSRVGLAAVDRSVFILAENRLNLQQVFDQLEQLYQKPQAELHEVNPLDKVLTQGAREVFDNAGVVVLSNQQVPAGREYQLPVVMRERGAGGIVFGAVPAAAALPTASAQTKQADTSLAEVQKVRQFFPETWLWSILTTDANGRASQHASAPDSITTWMLRAVALSKEKGLGIAEAQLRVLQPFFVQVDLPYSVIRGEQFPVKVALYNYTTEPQDFTVDLDRGDWFDLLGQATKTVSVAPGDVGGVDFTIRPQQLGTRQLKVTARSPQNADAVVKDIIVEPEGVARETVANFVVSAGSSQNVDTATPDDVIAGSSRAYLALTGNYLTQAIEGLEGLLQMPYGCGEQNMILFAPNVFVTRYLKETGQMKPEVMAKAESLMITGYQRELTYRRTDGSFSAFGNQDKDGSLWLTAFVLKTFAQAKGTIYIDDAVLSAAKDWIVKHQNADGSFDPFGFVIHKDLMGGLAGKTALTAYVAIALREAGENDASARAIRYLENTLDQADDAYTLALGTYALELAKSPKAAAAYDRLMKAAKESDDGLYWGDNPKEIQPAPSAARPAAGVVAPRPNRTASIETTGYALLALTEHGDRLNASRAARWLVSQRNAYGGYGSTQDTVVGLQALTRFAAGAKSDVDATVTLRSGAWQKEVRISPENADVLQLIDMPVGSTVSVDVKGKGQVLLQSVLRYNVPDPDQKEQSAFQIDVQYGADQIAVNDLIDVDVKVKFTPPEPMQAGMVVVDVAVPTGFAPETGSIEALVKQQPKMKRYDVAGRKVIFYIEDMAPDEQIAFSFQARALYPVRAQAVTSQAYAYYRPELKGESLGGALNVAG